MSVAARNGRYVVRWREDGCHRSMSFAEQAPAKAFDAKMRRRREQRRSEQLGAEQVAEMVQQVYVVRGGDKVKIGISVDPNTRVSDMQQVSPVRLVTVWRVRCRDARALETALHKRYAEHRAHGEWFEAEPVLADLEALAALGVCYFRRGQSRKGVRRTRITLPPISAA